MLPLPPGAATSLAVTNPVGNGDTGGRQAGLTAAELATADGGHGLGGMRECLLLPDGLLSAGRDGNEWVVEAKVPPGAPRP